MQNAALLGNPALDGMNMMGQYGGAYMDPALYQSYLQNYYAQAYQANAMGMGGYGQQQPGVETYNVHPNPPSGNEDQNN